jgi:hypothetical protein
MLDLVMRIKHNTNKWLATMSRHARENCPSAAWRAGFGTLSAACCHTPGFVYNPSPVPAARLKADPAFFIRLDRAAAHAGIEFQTP